MSSLHPDYSPRHDGEDYPPSVESNVPSDNTTPPHVDESTFQTEDMKLEETQTASPILEPPTNNKKRKRMPSLHESTYEKV